MTSACEYHKTLIILLLQVVVIAMKGLGGAFSLRSGHLVNDLSPDGQGFHHCWVLRDLCLLL